MSSQLTEEQKKRIEENRQRALAKRSAGVPVSLPVRGDKLKQVSQSHTGNLRGSNNPSLFPSNPSVKTNVPLSHEKTPQLSKANIANKQSGSSSRLSKCGAQGNLVIKKDKFYGLQESILKGRCVLMTVDRFAVEIGYHSSLVEFFKQMETRSYETSSRTWSFSMKEYEKLMKGVVVFQPSVVIEGLPRIILQTFKDFNKDDGIPEANLAAVDEKLVNALMPFQKEGVYFGIYKDGRILLADDMGLGKTLQALCIACYYRKEWPLLIVSPSSVRYDWARQTCQWLPSVDPQEVNVIDSGKATITRCQVTIISYDLLSKKVGDLKGNNYRVVIMDESHFLKNSKAVRTKAALNIVKSSKRVILLSGTPALSRPSELYSQISCVCPSMFKFHDFGVRYCNAKQQPWGWDYSGSSNMAELQLLLEKKIMIRRQKRNVLSQLPTKTRQVVVLCPNLIKSQSDLKKTYKVMNGTSLKGMERRGVLLQYFHETCKAKLAAVRDYIQDLVEADKKFLVFAHHQEMLDNIEEAIKEKVSYIRIDGRTTSEQRSFFCQKFQKSVNHKVAILSITAANAGLNLSAASLVIFAELFWNPGILVQAEDRVHRIGQENAVSIQYLTAQKTADDFIWPLVQDKLDVLSKAGLTKDKFSDADTMQAVDKSQRKILDMFTEELVETSESDVQYPDIEILNANNGPSQSIELPGPSLQTPSKRKRTSSNNSSNNSSPGSPSKRQMGIRNFFPVSPPKVSSLDSPSKRQMSIRNFFPVSPPKVSSLDSTNRPTGTYVATGTNIATCSTQTHPSSHSSSCKTHDVNLQKAHSNSPTVTVNIIISKSSSGEKKEKNISLSQEDVQILTEVDWDEEF